MRLAQGFYPLCLLFCLSFGIKAQPIQYAISDDTLDIGEACTVTLRITADAPISTDNFLPYLQSWQPTLKSGAPLDWEWISTGLWRTAPQDPKKFTEIAWQSDVYENRPCLVNSLSFRCWIPGDVAFPELNLPIGQLPTITIHVRAPIPMEPLMNETIELAPNFDILIEAPIWSDYIGLYLFFGLLAFVVFGFWWAKKRRKALPLPISEAKVPEISPKEKALNALVHLRETAALNSSTLKSYYSNLAEILQTLLEEQWGIAAKELTTEETMDILNKVLSSKDIQNELRLILTTADMVKYAKGQPEESQHATIMADAIAWVEKA